MDSQTQLDIKRLWQHIYALEARVAQLEAGSVKTSAPPLSDSKPDFFDSLFSGNVPCVRPPPLPQPHIRTFSHAEPAIVSNAGPAFPSFYGSQVDTTRPSFFQPTAPPFSTLPKSQSLQNSDQLRNGQPQ